MRGSLCTVRAPLLLPDSLELSGLIYDVRSGGLAGVREVAKVA